MTNIGSTWNKWDLHVHTASSYDAKYKGKDYDVKLVKAWSDYGIKAAAITDHGIIDASRIENIRKIIKDKGLNITVFPGVSPNPEIICGIALPMATRIHRHTVRLIPLRTAI